RVERVIGQGGMGVVYQARHLAIGQTVALKVLHRSSLSDPGALTRFRREAEASARLRSRHAVRVFDIGQIANGAPYIVMEYLEGADLAHLLRSRGPLPAWEAVDHVLEALEVLAEAHALGIIHRDLKPGNLFLAEGRDGTTEIKVLDFGVSKLDGAMSA